MTPAIAYSQVARANAEDTIDEILRRGAALAQALAETEAEYAADRRRQALLVVARQEACARDEAARLRARLAVALVEIETSGGQGA